MEQDRLNAMGKKIRLVISDMDGTLLNSRKEITDRTKKAILALREKGIEFTICTGRIPAMTEYYIKELNIRVPVVTTNGAVVWNPTGRAPLYDKEIPSDAAQELMDFLEFYEMDYGALLLETSYFSSNSTRIQKFEYYNEIAKTNGIPQMKLSRLTGGHSFLQGQKIYKVLVTEADPNRYRMTGVFLEKFPEFHVTCSDAGLWDVSASGVSKGTGLLFARNHMGLDCKEVCAFGDYYNDISMMKQAGFPIAMANGCDELKSSAVYVTESNDEDGVAKAIERFLL